MWTSLNLSEMIDWIYKNDKKGEFLYKNFLPTFFAKHLAVVHLPPKTLIKSLSTCIAYPLVALFGSIELLINGLTPEKLFTMSFSII